MSNDDGERRNAHVLGRTNEVALTQAERHTTNHARRDHPVEHREADHEEQPRFPLVVTRQNRENQQRWQHQEKVDEPHERSVDSTAEVARHGAHEGRQRRGEDCNENADDERLLESAHGLSEYVYTGSRGAEPVVARRWSEQVVEVVLVVVPRRKIRCDECGDEDDDNHRESEHRRTIADEATPNECATREACGLHLRVDDGARHQDVRTRGSRAASTMSARNPANSTRMAVNVTIEATALMSFLPTDAMNHCPIPYQP